MHWRCGCKIIFPFFVLLYLLYFQCSKICLKFLSNKFVCSLHASVLHFRISMKLFASLLKKFWHLFVAAKSFAMLSFIINRKSMKAKYALVKSLDLKHFQFHQIECHNWTICDDIIFLDLQPECPERIFVSNQIISSESLRIQISIVKYKWYKMTSSDCCLCVHDTQDWS